MERLHQNISFPFRGLLSTIVRPLLLAVAIVGMRTVSDEVGTMRIDYRFGEVAAIVVTVVLIQVLLPVFRRRWPIITGLLGLITVGLTAALGTTDAVLTACILVAGFFAAASCLTQPVRTALSVQFAGVHSSVPPEMRSTALMCLTGTVVVLALAYPFTPMADRYSLDLMTLLLTYLVLGWGLNIVVGLAGLLDLGFVAFYAVGAYSYALLSLHLGLSFWVCLPLAALFAAFAGFLLGFPVLRLRGDYFAIVTLGFGEIIRVVLLNWSEMSGGPDGLTGVARPSFFGMAEFTRRPTDDETAFHQMFGLEYSTEHRLIFLYFIVLLLAALAFVVAGRLRKMPIGRAWEALREDDIACQAMGISRARIKLWAFVISAAFGGMAGAFFATRQGYVSPESFTFQESAIVLAIVVLGGMGSRLGVLLATVVIIGLPEIFRGAEEFRMLAFGAAMILIMIWKPGGLLASRAPTIRLSRFSAGDTK